MEIFHLFTLLISFVFLPSLPAFSHSSALSRRRCASMRCSGTFYHQFETKQQNWGNISGEHSRLYQAISESELEQLYEYPPSALPNNNDVMSDNSTELSNQIEDSESSKILFDVLSLPLEPSFDRIMDSAKATRLLKYRSYARREAFMQESIDAQPTLADLSPPPRTQLETFWISPWYRWAILLSSYLIFPKITAVLETLVTKTSTELAEITAQFAPGVSILYGTFLAYTLSILYERSNKIQTNASTESAVLSLVCRNTLAIFRGDQNQLIEGGQCIADQIRHLVKESRGEELMCLIYSDPYSRLYELLLAKDTVLSKDNPISELISCSKEAIKDLIKLRSQRLSDEALALPPTHFFVLTTLTILILLGYTVSVLPTVSSTGTPSIESSLLFSVLCTVYVLFYNFANDLNNPFQGVYQIRRSSTAAHLLQIKWLIANHPSLKGFIHFDRKQHLQQNGEKILVNTPGLGITQLDRISFDARELRDH